MQIVCLEAQIKAQTFCELFQSLTKNTKQNQKLYFFFNSKQMKLGFKQNSKSTQMQLNLNHNSFKNYNFRSRNRNKDYILRKFQINKFSNFQTYFQTCKGFLKLEITEDKITFIQQSGKKLNKYPVKAQVIEQQEQQFLKQNGFIRYRQQTQQSQICQLQIHKARQIQEIIKAGNAMKIEKIYISYLPTQKSLRLSFNKNDKVYFKIKVNQIKLRGNPIMGLAFPFKKLKLAFGLLEAQKSLMMALDQQSMVIQFTEKDRKQFNITVLAQLNSFDQFS